MAVEARRGCGFRKVHGTYLVSGDIWATCDRLPVEVKPCPTCGGGIHFPLSLKEINPLDLFGKHDKCKDEHKPCPMCQPTKDPAYILGVGKMFYNDPTKFISEAVNMGVCKRVAFIPKNLKVGKTVIYLIHKKAIYDGHERYRMGVFATFVPKRIEKLFWESEKTDKLVKHCEKQGITPVWIPDGDKDHAGSVYHKGGKRGRPKKNVTAPIVTEEVTGTHVSLVKKGLSDVAKGKVSKVPQSVVKSKSQAKRIKAQTEDKSKKLVKV